MTNEEAFYAIKDLADRLTAHMLGLAEEDCLRDATLRDVEALDLALESLKLDIRGDVRVAIKKEDAGSVYIGRDGIYWDSSPISSVPDISVETISSCIDAISYHDKYDEINARLAALETMAINGATTARSLDDIPF